jgi:hypothetical protein
MFYKETMYLKSLIRTLVCTCPFLREEENATIFLAVEEEKIPFSPTYSCNLC